MSFKTAIELEKGVEEAHSVCQSLVPLLPHPFTPSVKGWYVKYPMGRNLTSGPFAHLQLFGYSNMTRKKM